MRYLVRSRSLGLSPTSPSSQSGSLLPAQTSSLFDMADWLGWAGLVGSASPCRDIIGHHMIRPRTLGEKGGKKYTKKIGLSAISP